MTGVGLGPKVLVASQFPAHQIEDLEMFDPSHKADSTWGTVSRARRGF